MTDWYLITDINPEPWTAPAIGRSGRAYKQPKLRAYQEALAEAFEWMYEPTPTTDPVVLEFVFQRCLYKGDQRADVTNIQKATEDALQGLLYANDNQVVRVSSTLLQQEAGIQPRVWVSMRPWSVADSEHIESDMSRGTLIPAKVHNPGEDEWTPLTMTEVTDLF